MWLWLNGEACFSCSIERGVHEGQTYEGYTEPGGVAKHDLNEALYHLAGYVSESFYAARAGEPMKGPEDHNDIWGAANELIIGRNQDLQDADLRAEVTQEIISHLPTVRERLTPAVDRMGRVLEALLAERTLDHDRLEELRSS